MPLDGSHRHPPEHVTVADVFENGTGVVVVVGVGVVVVSSTSGVVSTAVTGVLVVVVTASVVVVLRLIKHNDAVKPSPPPRSGPTKNHSCMCPFTV